MLKSHIQRIPEACRKLVRTQKAIAIKLSPQRKKRLEALAKAKREREAVIKKHETERGVPFEVMGHLVDKPRYPTAETEAMKTYGRNFLNQFKPSVVRGGGTRIYFAGLDSGYYESERAISIKRGLDALAWVNLGFEKGTLIIESMQTRRAERKALNEFRRCAHGVQALDYLLKVAEDTAIKSGYREIKIRNPQTLHFYPNPVQLEHLTKKQIQRQMKILYQKLAIRHGFKREGHSFYVKRLTS